MEHVGDLIGEKIIIVSIWEDGRLVGSSSLPPEFAKDLLELPGGPHELRIRSWRGTYNKTLRSDWDKYLQLINDHHSSVFGRASEP